uniref:Uncharacterized protein n=1 Tax=Cacopsylla melanoneura TaxID=428564 RepID=A0A8D8W6B9_9HEMI
MFKRDTSDHTTHFEKSSEWLLLICFNLFGWNLCTQILRSFIRRAFESNSNQNEDIDEWEDSEDGDNQSDESSNETQEEIEEDENEVDDLLDGYDLIEEGEYYLDDQDTQGDLFDTRFDSLSLQDNEQEHRSSLGRGFIFDRFDVPSSDNF